MKKRIALVVLSGGQDSTVCLALAKDQYDEVHAITFDYDQRHVIEIEAARNVARLVGVASHEVVQLGPILKGRSPLTDPSQPLEKYSDFATMDKIIGERVELTFVPMRNALFLTIAANRATCLLDNDDSTVTIFTGVCQADNANYPDCRQDFIESQSGTIRRALGISRPSVTIRTPLMYCTKRETIDLAISIDAYHLFAWTHTAYDGKYPPVGDDHASVLRAQGFLEAGIPDPLVIRAASEGFMPVPTTDNYSNPSNFLHIKSLLEKIGLDRKKLAEMELDAAKRGRPL